MRRILPIALLLSLSLLAGRISYAQSFVAAKVNQKAITYSELLDRYNFVVATSHLKVSSEAERKALLEQILSRMVDEEVILQAAKTFNVTVNNEEINEAFEEVASQQDRTAEQMRAFLKKNKLPIENHLKQIESEILWSKIVSGAVRPKVKVTEIEVREFLEQHKIDTEVKRFLLAEVVINHNYHGSEFLAKKLVLELRNGANFRNLANQFSGNFSENNGEIGWVSKGEIDAKIYAEISKVEKGGYSEPVLLGDGYHIFKVIDTKTEVKISENDLKVARDTLFGKKIQNLAGSFLMDLRKKAFVEIKL